MYLHREFEGMDGNFYKGAGVINGRAFKTPKLKNFGYSVLTANSDNLLCKEGESFFVHEFHYFDSTDNGENCIATKPTTGRAYSCVMEGENYWMGFPHLYYPSNPHFAKSFVEKAKKYKKSRSL